MKKHNYTGQEIIKIYVDRKAILVSQIEDYNLDPFENKNKDLKHWKNEIAKCDRIIKSKVKKMRVDV